MKPILLLSLMLLAVQAWSTPTLASACSDGGPPNGECNDGGARWIACEAHTDCPMGQLCGVGGTCQCYECNYGEMCTGDACRCAPQERPDAGPGCTVETDSCGIYTVRCLEMDAGPPPRTCNTDGATPRSCTVDADCAGAPHSGAGRLLCTSRGVCDCAPEEEAPAGGNACSAAQSAGGITPPILLAITALAFAARRRR